MAYHNLESGGALPEDDPYFDPRNILDEDQEAFIDMADVIKDIARDEAYKDMINELSIEEEV